MSTTSFAKTKHTRPTPKKAGESNALTLEALAVPAQLVAPALNVPLAKSAKSKLTAKKVLTEEETALDNSSGGAADTSAAVNTEQAQVYAQNVSPVSDATSSSATPSNLSAPEGTSTDSVAVGNGSGLSTAQMVGLGLLGIAAVGGITAIAISSSRSSSNNPDATAPQIQSLNAHSSSQTITLVYNEALDPSHLPLASAFTVSTNGVANTVSGVTVNGNVMTLNLANAFTAGALTIGYTDPSTGNDVNAIQDTSGNDASGFLQGIVADGYISGAEIYLDTNGNGFADVGESTGIFTQADGSFFLPSTLPNAAIIAVGGINIDTGLTQTTPLKAPSGSTTINPITTLLEAYIRSNAEALSADEASATIALSLGIDLPSGLNLLNFNPLANFQASSFEAQKIAAQIATLINLAAPHDASLAASYMSNLAAQIHSGSVDLTNPSTLNTILGGNATSLANTIAAHNANIHDATEVSQISTIQSDIGDNTVVAAPIVSSTDTVNDGLNIIRISFSGTGAEAGETVKVFANSVLINAASIKLDAQDIVDGYVDVALNLANGSHSIQAQIDSESSRLADNLSDPFNLIDHEVSVLSTPSSTLSGNLNFEYGEALTASLFAKAAYEHRTVGYIDTFLSRTGWQEINGNSELTNANAYGFAAKRMSTNGSIDYVISFEGSNSPFQELSDWTSANASKYGWSSYYESLLPLMKIVIDDALFQKRAGVDVEISITGHSLGGAAACVAYADLFCDPSLNNGSLWTDAESPLSSGSRIYSGYDSNTVNDIRNLLLPSINTYTFGAPSFLIEPTKLSGWEYAALAAETFVIGGSPPGWWGAALNFYQAAIKSITVDPTRLPDLTGYADHVFQFEHNNSLTGTWDDPVANIGTYDAGTAIELDLNAPVYDRYGGSWYNPIALHSIEYYGESIARLIENDSLTKTGTQLLSSTTATQNNDFILNATSSDALAGNDDFVYGVSGTYSATGNVGDDTYAINAYGVNLTLDGSNTDGTDTVYFALPGLMSATTIGSAVKFTITNGANSSSVTVNNWANHYVDQVAQIVETANPWRINYFDLTDINQPLTELNGLRYQTDGYGEPFVMAVPNGNSTGTVVSLPLSAPLIRDVTGEVSFMVNGNFDPTKPTYVYAHGWTDNARVDETGSIKAKLIYNAYVEKYGNAANIVMANWETLAAATRDPNESSSEPTFESSVTKQVGEVIADALIRAGADINNTTLVGHSLGSFVAGAAANEIVLRTGLKVKELVALDTAATNPFFPEYDIDARNGYDRSIIFGSGDAPYDFTDAIAQHTSSYTVIDSFSFGNSIGNLSGSSGNNARGSTADSAYLVAYVPSDVGYFDIAPASPFHNGVVAAYADLITKGDLNPTDANAALASLHFNDYGQPVTSGVWDGVLAVNQPWLLANQETFFPPKTIGWLSSTVNPTIYGSAVDDVMFFDQFNTDTRTGATLVGGSGNDFLGTSTGQGIDHLMGGSDNDTFFFGYLKNTNTVLPYLDGASWATDNGTDAFAIVEDYSSGDRLTFGWDQNNITITDGTDYNTRAIFGTKLSDLYGAGVAFSVNNDLVAYVKGISVSQVTNEITANDILFSSYANLDQTMLFATPAPVVLPTYTDVVI